MKYSDIKQEDMGQEIDPPNETGEIIKTTSLEAAETTIKYTPSAMIAFLKQTYKESINGFETSEGSDELKEAIKYLDNLKKEQADINVVENRKHFLSLAFILSGRLHRKEREVKIVRQIPTNLARKAYLSIPVLGVISWGMYRAYEYASDHQISSYFKRKKNRVDERFDEGTVEQQAGNRSLRKSATTRTFKAFLELDPILGKNLLRMSFKDFENLFSYKERDYESHLPEENWYDIQTLLNELDPVWEIIQESQHPFEVLCFLRCNEYKKFLSQDLKESVRVFLKIASPELINAFQRSIFQFEEALDKLYSVDKNLITKDNFKKLLSLATSLENQYLAVLYFNQELEKYTLNPDQHINCDQLSKQDLFTNIIERVSMRYKNIKVRAEAEKLIEGAEESSLAGNPASLYAPSSSSANAEERTEEKAADNSKSPSI